MSTVIPFPPAPEPGWYADDPVPAATAAATTTVTPTSAPSATAQPTTSVQTASAQTGQTGGLASTGLTGTGPIVTGTFVSDHAAAAGSPATSAAYAAQSPSAAGASSDSDAETDWDSTVLSSSFTIKQARKTYLLHNDVTGQNILIDRSVLLGRKPSEQIPEGAKAVKIEDPTRTTSRNHAAISIDQNGQLWIEDYGSLNGTFIIRDGEEHQVVKGTPAQLDAPATLRIGDQFFTLQEQ